MLDLNVFKKKSEIDFRNNEIEGTITEGLGYYDIDLSRRIYDDLTEINAGITVSNNEITCFYDDVHSNRQLSFAELLNELTYRFQNNDTVDFIRNTVYELQTAIKPTTVIT